MFYFQRINYILKSWSYSHERYALKNNLQLNSLNVCDHHWKKSIANVLKWEEKNCAKINKWHACHSYSNIKYIFFFFNRWLVKFGCFCWKKMFCGRYSCLATNGVIYTYAIEQTNGGNNLNPYKKNDFTIRFESVKLTPLLYNSIITFVSSVIFVHTYIFGYDTIQWQNNWW